MSHTRKQRGKAPPVQLKELQKTFRIKAERIKLQKQSSGTHGGKDTSADDKARNHYEQKLLQLTFRSWKDACASEVDERKEWSLLVRANYHYKYHLYLKVWRAWQVYVVRKRVKRAKESVALMQANYIILKRSFRNWKGHCTECRLKRATEKEAKDFLERKILQKFFVKWLDSLQTCREEKRMDGEARQHWKKTLKRKMLWEWKRFVVLQKGKRLKVCQAVRFYEKSLSSKCLYQGFLPYILYRRDRLEAKALASQFYMDRLQSRTFRHWRTRLAVHRHISRKREEIEALGRRSKLKRIMEHWKYYVKLCYTDRENTRMAVLHHRRSVMRMTFSSLQLAVVFRRVQIVRTERASAFHNRQVLKHVWTGWMMKIDDREEKEMFKDTKKAREHYRLLSLRKVMEGWKEYLKWRQHRKNDYRTADAHHLQVLCYKALCALAANVQRLEVKRRNTDQSNQFYRYHVMNASFYQWKESYHLSLEHRSMERMAILHHQKKSTRRTFQQWKYRTEDVSSGRDNITTARRYSSHQLCRQHFLQWREFVKNSKDRTVKEWTAKAHHDACILRNVWVAWRRDTLRRRQKLVSTQEAENHHDLLLLHQTMTHWKMHHKEEKRKRAICEMKYIRIMKERMRLAFGTWKSNVVECKRERQRHEAASDHRHNMTVSRVFSAWHRYTLNRAIKVQKQQRRLTEAVKRLDREKQRRCFCRWRRARTDSTTYRADNRKATEHRDKKIMKDVLKRWKEFKNIQTRKMILRQQSTWLNKTRLEAKCLLQWKKQYGISLRERTETNVALWHWSLVLQGNVLAAWRNYVTTRLEKKKRLEGAMVCRHQRLLKTGLRKWIITSDELSQKRVKFLSEQQSKVASKSFHVVRRCALHWRQKTLTKMTKENRTREPRVDSWIDESFRISNSSTFRSRPKRPDFLRSSLQNAGLWDSVEECLSSLPGRREFEDEDESQREQARVSYGEVDGDMLSAMSPEDSSRSHEQIPGQFLHDEDSINSKSNALGDEKLRDASEKADEKEKEEEDRMRSLPVMRPIVGLQTRKLLPPSAFTNTPSDMTERLAGSSIPRKVSWSNKFQEIPSEELEVEDEDEDEESVSDVRGDERQLTDYPVAPPEMTDNDDGDDDDDIGSSGTVVTTKDKLVELRTLLLKYQQLKDQINLLEDQRNVLTFLLDDPGEETQEEYELVQEDLTKHSQSLSATKLQISSLMTDIGLQSSFSPTD